MEGWIRLAATITSWCQRVVQTGDLFQRWFNHQRHASTCAGWRSVPACSWLELWHMITSMVLQPRQAFTAAPGMIRSLDGTCSRRSPFMVPTDYLRRQAGSPGSNNKLYGLDLESDHLVGSTCQWTWSFDNTSGGPAPITPDIHVGGDHNDHLNGVPAADKLYGPIWCQR